MPWHAKVPLVFSVGISLRASLMRHAMRRGSGAVVEFELREDQCALRFDKERALAPATLVGLFVHPWLVILRLRIDSKHWPVAVVITRNGIDAGAFRELRVRLHVRNTVSETAPANL